MTNKYEGPFELTKTAMVIAKEMALSATKAHDPIRKSYSNKGTFRTAQQIVRNCGPMGLYSGFQLQFRKLLPQSLHVNYSNLTST